jgi:hypothetical protein
VVHDILFGEYEEQLVVEVPAAVVPTAPVVVHVALPGVYDEQFVLEAPAAPLVVHDTLFAE